MICAGGPRLFTCAYVLIVVLRRTLGCRLPIEVWHLGPREISPAMAGLLRELDVDLIDASAIIAERAARIRDGWQLKPFAVMWSRFAEVLLLDADQVPVVDPAAVFEWPQYHAAGAVFWPDIVDLREDNPVWALVGVAPRRTVSFESGQLAIDKRRHWRALSIVLHLNEEADTFYQLIYGDKDTFLLGWLAAKSDYALVPHRPFADDRALFQRDFAGAPILQHRTNAKWVYAGKQIAVPGFVHEGACLAALDALKARWGGRVFVPPPAGAVARARESELTTRGPLRVEIVADDAFVLELLPHGEIGAGRSYDRRNWFVGESDSGALALEIVDSDRITYRLHPLAPGRWGGRRLRTPEAEITATLDGARASEPEFEPAQYRGLVDELLSAAGFPAANRAADRELARTLALLDRATAGVAARLAALAASRRPTDPAVAERLDSLATAIAKTAAAPPRAVPDSRAVLLSGYARPDGSVE